MTRDEAQTILSLIDGTNLNDSTLKVLAKIEMEHPTLLNATLKAKVREFERTVTKNKEAATKKINTLLEDIAAKMRECTQIADAANIGFDFDTQFGSSWYTPDGGWNSSNC